MAPRYRFTLASSDNSEKFPLNNYISAEYLLSENAVTPLVMSLPASEYPEDLFSLPDKRIYVERAANDVVPLELEGQTCWFIRQLSYLDNQDGVGLIDLRAVCANALLDDRIIAYPPNTLGVPGSIKLDYADNLMKAIIRENYGSLASDTDRNISNWLKVETDSSDGPQMLKEFGHRRVLETLLEISDYAIELGTWVGFHVSVDPDTGILSFRTAIGQLGNDLSDTMIVSKQSGSLVAVDYNQDWSEHFSVVYAGGAAVGEIRPILKISNSSTISSSPFSRRETFLNAGNASDASSLLAEADAEIQANKPKIRLSGTLNETESSLYGYHYHWGDRIKADTDFGTFIARVKQVRIRIADNVSTAEAVIESEA